MLSYNLPFLYLSLIHIFIILRELQPSEDYSDLDDIAHMLVDMLNTEAMTSAWVSYSNIADDLKQLPDARCV